MAQEWLRIKGGKSHAVLKVGVEIEFHCGKQRRSDDLEAPRASTPQCNQCRQYLAHRGLMAASSPRPLPSTVNTRAIERRIRAAVRAMGYRGTLVYEHGHWWLTLPDGTDFDVVDASGGDSVDGFGLERIS